MAWRGCLRLLVAREARNASVDADEVCVGFECRFEFGLGMSFKQHLKTPRMRVSYHFVNVHFAAVLVKKGLNQQHRVCSKLCASFNLVCNNDDVLHENRQLYRLAGLCECFQ